MIEEAAEFASQVHAGTLRKGTDIPYITHPVECAMIVSLMTEDEELIAAALLHDVIEDAGVSAEELQCRFGTRVAELVADESEDKSKTWLERKSATIHRLKTADRDTKLLVLGDKLSNLRSTAKDYLVIGDAIWQRFHVTDKKLHAWYYGQIAKELKELGGHPCYQEYLLLYKNIFEGEWYETD